MFRPITENNNSLVRTVRESDITRAYDNWKLHQGRQENVGGHIHLIRWLRMFRTEHLASRGTGLKECKDAVEAANSIDELMYLFDAPETDVEREKRTYEFCEANQAVLAERLPAILEHYKDFGSPDSLSALQFALKSFSNNL